MGAWAVIVSAGARSGGRAPCEALKGDGLERAAEGIAFGEA